MYYHTYMHTQQKRNNMKELFKIDKEIYFK